MTEKTPFHIFIALIEHDQSINQRMQEKTVLHQRNQSLSHDLSLAKTRLQQAHDTWVSMRKAVDERELEMKVLDEQEKKKKLQMDRLTDYKEYGALKTEINSLKQQQHILEESLLAAWHSFDQAKKEYDAQKLVFANAERTIQESIAQNDDVIKSLEDDIAQRESQRVDFERQVPQEWLDKYSLMRARVTNPVVPVVNGSCSACFYHVLGQDMVALNHRKLLQCKDCFRLLYLPETMHASQLPTE